METALREALPLAEAAVRSGAQILFLPEYCGGLSSQDGRLEPPSDKEERHLFLTEIQNFAAKSGVWVQIGSIAIDAPDGKILNRGYMIDPSGDTVGHYDKIHLFDVNLAEGAVYRESDTVVPGGLAQVYETPFGKIGHTICYDLRFPGLYRDLAHAGAEILCCPAAFTSITGEAHWHVLNRARAIENTAFVVSACAVGPVPGGGESFGHSLVINPWGEVLADGGKIPGVIHSTIDLDLVVETSKRVPSLTHDRSYVMTTNQKRDVA